MNKKVKAGVGRAWATFRLAAGRFILIDGEQWAAAFAYSAFFSLFPLIILLVTGASILFDQAAASALVVAFIGQYIPITGDMKNYVFDTISGVISARGQAGSVAFFMLVWIATQTFNTLILAANRAWGSSGSRWWTLPLKSLELLLVINLAVITLIWVPVLERVARGLLPHFGLIERTYSFFMTCLPWTLIFLSLSLFYKVAPHRKTKFSEVWAAALCGTALLAGAQYLFTFYLKHYATFNAVYGAFGGVMALLLWIYISGLIFIFCACLSAAQNETGNKP
ncbi:MAG: YihY/virulence factor BrkB family protein [Elusimicrobia bacterium]|nr:YihY/virulence factor BrkB family protein [Elusimicrobiota bacterium]